jgi:hypothetical protein
MNCVVDDVALWLVSLRVFLFSPVSLISPSTICCSYQKGKEANEWNLKDSNAVFGNRRAKG